MVKKMSKSIANSFLAVSCLLAIAAPPARSNAETRHTLVLPGTCISSGFAGVTFSHNSLTLTSDGPNAVAAAIVTSTIPNVGLTSSPIPQGTLTFTAVKNDSNSGGCAAVAAVGPNTDYDNEYEIDAFYQNGRSILKAGSLSPGTTNFSVNTVKSGMGQLLAVSFLYVGGEENVGVVTVSNFRINNIPANGFDLSNPQTCSPYVRQISEDCI